MALQRCSSIKQETPKVQMVSKIIPLFFLFFFWGGREGGLESQEICMYKCLKVGDIRLPQRYS